MKERNDKVFKNILNKAFTQTMENFSFMVDLNNGEDKLSVSFEEYFEDTLANARLMSENSKEKSAACASAFALHSVNMIAQTREIHNRIDDFFASADNRDWFKENGISDDEKPALCSELKDYISDEMKIKGSTKEENDFIERVNAVFDSSKEELPTDQLKHTLDFISNVNKYLQNDYNAKDALNAAYNDSSFMDSEHKITDVIFEGISKISGAIDKEAVDVYMKDISANYIEDNEVTAASFSEHYSADPTNLTPDEKVWAHKVYGRLLFNSFDLENGYDFENMDYTSFLVNGEQIISNEEYEKSKDENGIISPEKCQEMEEKLAAKVASGADISVRMYAPEKTVDIDPADIKLKGIDAMSYRMFDNHYKDDPGRLTDYDKEWAMKAFDKLTPEDKGWAMNVAGTMGIEYGDFENLKLNGKKMFEPWNLHKEDELDRTADVVGALLSGKEVALENQKDNTLTLLNPMIKGTLKERESKGIIDTIIEFFKSLVGIDSRQKEQDKIKMMDLDAQKAKTNFMEKSRERISFKELSGLNSLKKVNAPTQKQNTLSAEKKGASRGK